MSTGCLEVRYPVLGQEIAADHAYPLYSAIARIVPAFHGLKSLAILPISGRLIGGRSMALSRSSHLTLRLPTDQLAAAQRLAGAQLRLGSASVRLGPPRPHLLRPWPRLRSRLVIIKGFMEPEPFLAAARRQLESLGVEGRPALLPVTGSLRSNGGTRSAVVRRTLRIRDREIVGFAVAVNGLAPEDSLALQTHGIGGRRRFGCGVFVRVREEHS